MLRPSRWRTRTSGRRSVGTRARATPALLAAPKPGLPSMTTTSAPDSRARPGPSSEEGESTATIWGRGCTWAAIEASSRGSSGANARQQTLGARGAVGRAALGAVFQRWRQRDWIAAQRVDAYMANSQTTKRRVARYFGREATVLHPPVELERFAPARPRDAYVVLSELMPHKRNDIAIRAFRELRLPLVVVGNGPDARRLHRLAGR